MRSTRRTNSCRTRRSCPSRRRRAPGSTSCVTHLRAFPSSSATASSATRLYVDRVFTLQGVGTIATGTLWSGTIAAGDTLRVEPSGRIVRVRSVQVHDEAVDAAQAGQRVAVNLPTVERRELKRGDVLVEPGHYPLTYRLDVVVDEIAEIPADVTVHIGTQAVPARVVRAGRFAQLRLTRPVVALRGDRVVLRTDATVGRWNGARSHAAAPPRARASRDPRAGRPRRDRPHARARADRGARAPGARRAGARRARPRARLGAIGGRALLLRRVARRAASAGARPRRATRARDPSARPRRAARRAAPERAVVAARPQPAGGRASRRRRRTFRARPPRSANERRRRRSSRRDSRRRRS